MIKSHTQPGKALGKCKIYPSIWWIKHQLQKNIKGVLVNEVPSSEIEKEPKPKPTFDNATH